MAQTAEIFEKAAENAPPEAETQALTPVPTLSVIPPNSAIWTLEDIKDPAKISAFLEANPANSAIAVRLQKGTFVYLLGAKNIPSPPAISQTVTIGMGPGFIWAGNFLYPRLSAQDLMGVVTNGTSDPSEKHPSLLPVTSPDRPATECYPEILFYAATAKWLSERIEKDASAPDFKFIAPNGDLIKPDIMVEDIKPDITDPPEPTNFDDIIVPADFGEPKNILTLHSNLKEALVLAQIQMRKEGKTVNQDSLSFPSQKAAKQIWDKLQERLRQGPLNELTGQLIHGTPQGILRKVFKEGGLFALSQKNIIHGYLMPLSDIEAFLENRERLQINSHTDFKVVRNYAERHNNMAVFCFKMPLIQDEGVLVAYLPLAWLLRVQATIPIPAPAAAHNHSLADGP